MSQSLKLLSSLLLAMTGSLITKYSLKPDSGYRVKILGPGLIIGAIILLYQVIEDFFSL